MPETTQSHAAPLIADVRHAWSEMAEMVSLRRRLAETELRSDLATSKRLAWSAGIGLVAALTGLPVLVMALSAFADSQWQFSFPWISTIAGSSLFVGGLLFASAAWWKFRRDFLGFQQSLAELQEDLVWLREWSGDQAEDDVADDA